MKFYTTVYKKECKSLEYYLCPGAIANRVKCKLMVADCWLRTKTNTLAARSERTGLIFDPALRPMKTKKIKKHYIIYAISFFGNGKEVSPGQN